MQEQVTHWPPVISRIFIALKSKPVMDNFGAVGLSMLGTFLSAANLTGDVLIADVNGGKSPNDAWRLLLNFGRSASELKGLEGILDSGLFSFSLQILF